MSKPEAWKSWEGRVVDGFPLRQWLGGSDHSAVFLTEIAGTPSQKAALKLIAAESGAEAERQISRLRATTKLSHPNLIQTFRAGQFKIDGIPVVYAVMEFADEDLSQILPQRALESAEVSDMLPPLLGALSYLHASGLVHGRIKPSNVLAAGDRLKLSSDQVASPTDPNSQRKRGDVYDAPEIAAGSISPASDIWSLGILIVAAFAQSASLAPVDSPRDPSVSGTVPEPFRGIAHECLHGDPKQRYSIAQIEARLKGQELRPAAPVSPAVATNPHSRTTTPTAAPTSTAQAEQPRKRPAFPITIGVAVLLACIFAFSYFRSRKPAAQSPDAAPQPIAATSTSSTSTSATPAISGTPASAKSPNPAGEVSHQVLPDVSQSALHTINGTIKVIVKAQVDASGKVSSAAFKSAGSSRYFAERALTAAQHWQFSPPQSDGQSQASTWLIQFRFKRSSTQASAQRVTR